MVFNNKWLEIMRRKQHPCHIVAIYIIRLGGELMSSWLIDALCEATYGIEVADFSYERLCEMEECAPALREYRRDACPIGQHLIDLVLREQEEREAVISSGVAQPLCS